MAQKILNTRIIIRNDTALAWSTSNPVLLAGEFGCENDTGKIKIGDGKNAWVDLAYASSHVFGDNVSIQKNLDGTMSVVGFAEAIEGSIPHKTADGRIEWVSANLQDIANLRSDVNNIFQIIGDVPDGKTVIELIEESQSGSDYDDTAIAARVKNNEDAIALLNADAQSQGSVDYKIAQAIAGVMNNPDETINSIQELVLWTQNHAADAIALSNKVAVHDTSILSLQDKVGSVSVAEQITAALQVDGKDKYALASIVDSLEKASHIHDNASVLAGITEQKVAAWDVAQPNVIEVIQLNGSAIPVVDKTVNIPAATIASLGIVRGDGQTLDVNNGVMSVKSVGISKVFIEEGTELVLDGGVA